MRIGRAVLTGTAAMMIFFSVPSVSGEAPAPEAHGAGAAAARWFEAQKADGLCGPTAVAMAASQLTGRRVTAFEVRAAAVKLGLRLRTNDGWGLTSRGGLVRLLDRFGIDASDRRTTRNGLRLLLDEGRALVVHVDASLLWHGRDAGPADHFAVLTGIDDRDGTAILNDPGLGPALGFEKGTGAAYTVPLEVFEAAWAASGRHVVVSAPASSAA